MSTGLRIERRECNSAVVLDLSGRLTAGAGAGRLRETVRELADSGRTRVLLNLREVSFMDSTGLGALVISSELLNARGGRLCILNALGPVRHVLHITRLDRVFPDFSDEQSALESLAS